MARRGIPDQNSPALGLAFILAALGNYVFAWWWQRFKIAGLLKQASDAASRRDKTQLWNSLRQLQAHVIVFLAIVEAPVIYGFVHRLINAYFPQLMEHFLVVSVIIFVVFRRGTMAEIFRLYDQADSIQ